MTNTSNKCHHLHQDLQISISLLKKDIWFHILKIVLSLIVIILLVKYSNNFKIQIKLELTFENTIALLTFFLELKILSDLNDSIKKLYKLKVLRSEIVNKYPGSDSTTCESEACYMMKRVMEGTLN